MVEVIPDVNLTFKEYQAALQQNPSNIFYQRYISAVFMDVFNRYFKDLDVPYIILDTWDLEGRKKSVSQFLGV